MVSAAAAAVRWAGEAGWAEGGAGPGSVGTVVSTEAVGSKEGGVVAKVGLSVVWWAVAVEAARVVAARAAVGTGAAGGVEVGWGAAGPVVWVGAAEAMAVAAREVAVAAGG